MPKIPKLEPPKISFSAVGQIVFVFKEAFKIVWAVEPHILVLVVSLGILWGLTTLPTLYLGKAIIDTALGAIGKPNPENAIKLIALFIILQTLINITRQTSSSLIRTFQQRLNWSADAYIDRVLGTRLDSLDIVTIESADFRDKFEKIKRESPQRIWGLVYILGQIPQNLTGLISSLVPIFLFNPLLLVAILILEIPNLIFDREMTKKSYDLESTISNKHRVWNNLYHSIVEPRNNLEPKLLGNVSYLTQKMKKVQEEIFLPRVRLRTKWVTVDQFLALPSWIFETGFNLWLFIQVIFAKMTLGTAQMLFNASGNFSNYTASLLNNFIQAYENYLYVVDFVWFMNLKPQTQNGIKKASPEMTQGIESKDVWFRYPKTSRWVLKGINLKIEPRDNAAIVGENGAGKTTLIKLLGRFYGPNKGQILVNGVNILDYEEKSYWKQLSVLFQDFEQYPYSARETIGYGDVGRIGKIAEIMEAAKQTGTHEYIQSLEKGYDTPLKKDFEGGVNPSGGQWQRIALARTLFRKANIIILDEPTSNVDPKAEEEIFDKVIDLTRDKILILISHRFSTVRRADKIFVIEKGRMIEEGSHETLIKKNGVYAKLFSLQAKGYL